MNLQNSTILRTIRRGQVRTCDNAELRMKIDEAKQILPMPALMRHLGYDEKHIGKSAHCCFHPDKHKSFSVFKKADGSWWHRCFVGCSSGDEIAFVVKHFNTSRREAIRRYLDMAGFPARSSAESREYLASPASPASPECPASPVSEGQGLNGELHKVLKILAAQNTCTQLNTARSRRWKLLRDLKGIEKKIRRKLNGAELTTAFNEWHARSLPFLDPAKTSNQYEAKFLSEFGKVRYATGDGTLATALENVAKLSPDQLPILPDKPDAPESWRRIAALHSELSRLCSGSVYFLSYRDAAKVFDGMCHQEAHTITGALETLGVIDIVSNGKSGINSREAAEFRYLLLDANGAEDDGGVDLGDSG